MVETTDVSRALREQFDGAAVENCVEFDEDISNDDFNHKVIPYTSGYISSGGHGIVDISYVNKEITTRKVVEE